MNNSTQNKMASWYRAYLNTNMHTIEQAYNSPSAQKIRAYYDIVRDYCKNFDAHAISILHRNSYQFTTGAICQKGNDFYFVVETFTATYICGYDPATGDIIDLDTGEIIE